MRFSQVSDWTHSFLGQRGAKQQKNPTFWWPSEVRHFDPNGERQSHWPREKFQGQPAAGTVGAEHWEDRCFTLLLSCYSRHRCSSVIMSDTLIGLLIGQWSSYSVNNCFWSELRHPEPPGKLQKLKGAVPCARHLAQWTLILFWNLWWSNLSTSSSGFVVFFVCLLWIWIFAKLKLWPAAWIHVKWNRIWLPLIRRSLFQPKRSPILPSVLRISSGVYECRTMTKSWPNGGLRQRWMSCN